MSEVQQPMHKIAKELHFGAGSTGSAVPAIGCSVQQRVCSTFVDIVEYHHCLAAQSRIPLQTSTGIQKRAMNS